MTNLFLAYIFLVFNAFSMEQISLKNLDSDDTISGNYRGGNSFTELRHMYGDSCFNTPSVSVYKVVKPSVCDLHVVKADKENSSLLHDLQVSEDEKIVAGEDKKRICIFDVKTSKCEKFIELRNHEVIRALRVNGGLLAVALTNNNVAIFDIYTGKREITVCVNLPFTDFTLSLAKNISRDLIVCIKAAKKTEKDSIRVYDLDIGKRLGRDFDTSKDFRTFSGEFAQNVVKIANIPDSVYVLTQTQAGMIYVWENCFGEISKKITGGTKKFQVLGESMVLLTYDNFSQQCYWDLFTGEKLAGNTVYVGNYPFRVTSRRNILICASYNNRIELYDLERSCPVIFASFSAPSDVEDIVLTNDTIVVLLKNNAVMTLPLIEEHENDVFLMGAIEPYGRRLDLNSEKDKWLLKYYLKAAPLVQELVKHRLILPANLEKQDSIQ